MNKFKIGLATVHTIGRRQQRALCPIAAQVEVNCERLVGGDGALVKLAWNVKYLLATV
jgi:hypothetical protein